METRPVALPIVFSALAVALNPIRIPTVYWPMWSYYVYEIPIVVAFLLLGPRIGIAVAGLHLLGQEVFFSNGLGGLLAYPIGTVAILVTLLGTHLATMYIKHK